MKRLLLAAEDSGIDRIVAGGGVAANSYLRESLGAVESLEVIFPPLELCTDNGAMIAGLGYHMLKRNGADPLTIGASARVEGFRKTYP